MEIKKRSRVLAVLLIMAVTFMMLFVDCGVVSAETTDTSQGIAIDETSFPDAGFRSYVSQFDTDNDGCLSEEECSQVTQIYVSLESRINSLSGIEVFTNLKDLSCYGLRITELDVSQNTQLELLNCIDTRITELDVSTNKNLKTLECAKTRIASLDLSQNVSLEQLNCSESFVKTLDLSANVNLKSLNCSATGITELDLENNKVLETLTCEDMNISSLNLSKNSLLKYLDCNYSRISELNVTNNKNLITLLCSGAKVESLDLKQNIKLESLNCSDTLIKALDLSENKALERLNCSATEIKELDLSKNEWLVTLNCSNTQITKLNLSHNKSLRGLSIANCPIAYLDLSNNNLVGTGEAGEVYLSAEITINTNEDTLDLEKQFPGIDVSRILEIYTDDMESDIKLEGSILSGYHDGTTIWYTYDCKALSTRVNNLCVIVHFYGDSTNGSDSSSGSSGSSGGFFPSTPTLPTEQKPVISEGEGYSTFIGDNGKTVLIVADEEYDVKDVKVNGVSKGAVKKVTSLKSGDKVEVLVVKKNDVIKEIEEKLKTVSKDNFKARSAQVVMKNGKNAIKITWKNTSGVKFDGIEVYRSTKKNSGYGKRPIYTSKSDKYYNTSVKKNTRYYYKVRGYIEYDGMKYYSGWSTKAWRTAK